MTEGQHPTLLDRFVEHVARHQARIQSDPSLIEAAVAIVLVTAPEALLLIRRAERADDPWSGQMGLPGGRRGSNDPDLGITAVRETREEVGVDLSAAQLVGTLDDLTPTTVLLPRIKVRPFVFLLRERQLLVPSQEVAAATWAPLAEFVAPGTYGVYEVEARGLRFERPAYRLPFGVVWGMTERILTPPLAAVEPRLRLPV